MALDMSKHELVQSEDMPPESGPDYGQRMMEWAAEMRAETGIESDADLLVALEQADLTLRGE